MVLPQAVEGPGPRLIQEGDLVIVYESYTSIKSVYVNSKQTYQSRFGTFPHKDWVGTPFGSRSHSRPPGHGWVQLLAPTPELWTLVLRHRTQILYIADISMVVAHLDLRPGCVVLESGTGSASLTHSLARAVAPGGRVRSFEFHELRQKEAAAELLRNGLPPELASVSLRNIEEKGFPVDELEGAADGVFLDLPGPWKVVPSAAKCLKPNGRFCSFSPCIEQVQRTCEQLDACGMTDIVTYEVLLRNYEVAEETLLAPALDDAPRAGDAGNAAGTSSAEGAQAGGDADAGPSAGAEAAEGAQPRKRARVEGGEEAGKEGGASAEQAQEGAQEQEQEQAQVEAQGQQLEAAGGAAAGGGEAASEQPGKPHRRQRGEGDGGGSMRATKMVVCKPSMDARGHTGYLTFARKFL